MSDREYELHKSSYPDDRTESRTRKRATQFLLLLMLPAPPQNRIHTGWIIDPVDDNMKSLVEQRQHQHQSPVTVTAQQLPNQSPNHHNNIMATTTKVVILWRRRSLRFVSQLWLLLLLLLWFLMMYVHEEDGGGHSRRDDTWTMTIGTVTTVTAFSSMAQQKPPLRIRTTFPRVTTTQQQQQQYWYKRPQLQLKQQHHPKPQHRCSAVAKSDTNGDATDSHVNTNMGGTPPQLFQQTDPIIRNAAKILQRTSWLSWWCQVILTVISSVILLFAKSNSSITNSGGGSSNFVLSTVGLLCSIVSIVWTWGNGTRLSRRFLIRPISRQQVQSMIRRAIQVGITLNCLGLLCHLLAAQQIIGLLAVKVLTNNRSGGGGGLLLAAALDGSSNTLQPLDILIVQANTNALLSQYLSLVLLLSLMVRILPTLPEPVIVTTTTTTDF
jgi:Protein of unknown function (DUF3611)